MNDAEDSGTQEIEYLTLEDAVGLARRLEIGPIRDLGLLDSALARPAASAFGTAIYPTVALQAAALLQSITANHALVDGNKRLAWIATATFLDLNGWTVDVTDDEAFTLMIDVASGMSDLDAIVARLRIGRP